MGSLLPIGIIVLLAWAYDFVNGMNDCANAIATTVSTRALSPRQAIFLAFAFNVLGAFVSTEVAKTIGKGILNPEIIDYPIIVSSLVGAIIWAGFCTHYGIPISITHSLVGGLIGAGIAAKGIWALEAAGIKKVLIAMVVSPVAGFVVGYILLVAIFWMSRALRPEAASSYFRKFQVVSAAFMALSHGANDTQNAMGVVTAALLAGGFIHSFEVPPWVVLGSGIFMGLGTYFGGWKVIKTLGMKMVKLRPVHGFSAETASALVILGNTLVGAPISTTHVITTAVMGVGSTEKLSGVKWGLAGHIVLTWILTIPATAMVAALTYGALSALR
ncbi:MAG TPA: inorganic phosphate transporter [Bacteroidota bacterium]